MFTTGSTAGRFRQIAFAASCIAPFVAFGSAAWGESTLQQAANTATKGKPAETARVTSLQVSELRYIPPLRGAPSRRIGGATRNLTANVDYLAVIAPLESGLTIQSTPRLYWYLPEGTDAPVEITVLHPNEIEPRIEIRIQGPVSSGMHQLSLAEHGVELETGVAYEWHVAVVPNESERSADIVSSGSVMRAPESPQLESRIVGKGELEKATILAAEGIWYDAIDVLVSGLERDKDNSGLREGFTSLLRQVGLDRIAADY